MTIVKETKRKEITGDLYFFDIVGDRIVINTDYDGIAILDLDFNVLKNIVISDDLRIYNSFALSDELIVLNCVENAALYVVNIKTGDVKHCMIPDRLSDKILKCLVKINAATAVFQTYDGVFCCLGIDSMEMSLCEPAPEYELMTEGQAYNIDSEFVLFEDVHVNLSEKAIVFRKAGINYTIVPKEGYYFIGLKVISNDSRSLIVFSSSGDSGKAIITGYSI